MTKKQWKIIIGLNLLVILLVSSPFFPGPGFLSGLTNSIFNLAQIGGFLALILVPIGSIWMIAQIWKKKKIKATPILMCTVPIVAFTLSIWGVDPVRDFSRNFAINNTEDIIHAIETYYEVHDQYPEKLTDLEPKFIEQLPQPWIMGISGYVYEKRDETFILNFTQNVLFGFNFEVVVYDPAGKHKAGGELKTLYPTGKPNWKYYIFD